MGRPSTKVKVVCQYSGCGKEFYTIPMYLRTGRGKYCGRSCYTAARTGVKRGPLNWNGLKEVRICEACDKPFEVGFGTGKQLDQKLCSNECQRLARYRHGASAKELNGIDAAYIAGFLDGEGSIFLTSRKNKASLRISATNTDKNVLDWIIEKIGVGVVHAGRKESDKNRKTWMFILNGEAAETLLKQLLPYLIVKKEQAQLAIETQERLRVPALNADRTWQQEYIIKMKLLNQRGSH